MQICPQCRAVYSQAGVDRCAHDGVALVDAEAYSDAQNDPLIDHTVAGRFHIVARIGIGGMGTVYRATQSGLDRDVALKILKRDATWDKDTVTRFHREAKAMSLLMHPNTVRVFDFGETDDGLLFLAMEMLEGEVLSHRIERQGALDVGESIRIVQQILGSLHEAHSKGIIHRDLKPDNIVLARVEGHEEPVVKVLDFGIAKIIQGDRQIDSLETQAGTVFGTPRYMSPEQAQGKPLDARSDVYSVGILLYHLLVGRPPFVDDDAVVVMAKHIKEKPVPPRRAAPEQPIPIRLERVVMQALEKDREKRVQSATALVQRLEACRADLTAELEARIGATPRRSRLPVMPTVAGGLIVLAALGIGGYLAFGPGPGDPSGGAPPLTGTPPAAHAAARPSMAILDSEPHGAEVWHDQSRLGTTPLRVPLAAGRHLSVELRKDGFETAPGELVADGQAHLVHLAATPAPAPAAATATLTDAAPTAAVPTASGARHPSHATHGHSGSGRHRRHHHRSTNPFRQW